MDRVGVSLQRFVPILRELGAVRKGRDTKDWSHGLDLGLDLVCRWMGWILAKPITFANSNQERLSADDIHHRCVLRLELHKNGKAATVNDRSD